MREPDMPALRAYKRGDMSARQAVLHAEYMDEAEAIIAEAKRREEILRREEEAKRRREEEWI